MVNTATDIFDETLLEFEKTNPSTKWKTGARQKFLSDLQRDLQFVNGQWRTRRGSKIGNIQEWIAWTLERDPKYQEAFTVSPFSRQKYQPVFPVRDDVAKKRHRTISETFFRKCCAVENYIFQPGMEGKVSEVIAENFLPSDGPEGTRWHLVSDTEIGTLWSKKSWTLDEVLNISGAARFIDDAATKISRLAHRAQLVQQAKTLAEAGTNPADKDVKKLTAELEAFERRNLKVGRTLPPLNRAMANDEFVKFGELNGGTRSEALAQARQGMEALDNALPVAAKMAELEQPKDDVQPHEF